MSASSAGQDKTLEEGRGKKGGIVPGHAYTILQVIFLFSIHSNPDPRCVCRCTHRC
jgi:hypothetical protein